MSRRQEIIVDYSLRGLEACNALSDATDEWLKSVFLEAIAGEKKSDDIGAEARVGTYGA